MLAAGQGSRFKEYTTTPKPLIDVLGVPMYEHTLGFLNIKNNYEVHVLFQKEFAPKNNNYNIHTVDYYTEGAAESAYTVIKNYRDIPWLIMDCDAVIHTDKIEYTDQSSILIEKIVNFDLRSSYSTIKNNKILCTAEKQVISSNRNVGMYYWSNGEIFCNSYERVKSIDYKVNGEYYIAPLYNFAIMNGETVIPNYVNNFRPIGTPVDLESYINENNIP